MPIFFKDQLAMFFSHVPKTGGSYVERIARLNGWRVLLHEPELEPNALPGLKRSPQHLPWAISKTLVDKTHFSKMAMIYRDPFERFCSEFFWLKTKLPELSVDRFTRDFLANRFESSYNFDAHLSPQKDYFTDGMNVFFFDQAGVDEACKFFFGDTHKKHGTKEMLKNILKIRIDKATQKDPNEYAHLLKFKKEISEAYTDDYFFASTILNASGSNSTV